MRKVYLYLGLSIILFVIMYVLKGSIEILDTKLFYSKAFIEPFFESLGEEGRSRYSVVNWIDFGFMTAITLTLLHVYKVFFEKDDMYKSLLWIPIVYWVVDFVETSIILYFNNFFPQTSDILKLTLMLSTPIKWFFVMSSLLVVVNGYFLKLYIQKTGSN